MHRVRNQGLTLGVFWVLACSDSRPYPQSVGEERDAAAERSNLGGRGGGGEGGGGRGGDDGGLGGAADSGFVAPVDAPDSRPTDATSTPATGAEIAAFVGVWDYVGGIFTTDCGGNVVVEPAWGSLELQAGADAPLWHLEGSCAFRLDVTGGTAQYRMSPTCAEDVEGNRYTLVPTSGTIQLDGRAVIVTSSFLVIGQGAAAAVNCKLRVDANAVRMSRGASVP